MAIAAQVSAGNLTAIYADWQQRINTEQQAASAPLSALPSASDVASLTPQARLDLAQTRVNDTGENFDKSVGNLPPEYQAQMQALERQTGQEFSEARKAGKPYDPQANYTGKVMAWADSLLNSAGNPSNPEGSKINVKGVGDVFHNGAEYFQARKFQYDTMMALSQK